MLEIQSKFEYSVDLKNVYRAEFLNDPSNSIALHQYILSLIFGSQFVDETGKTNMDLIEELSMCLDCVAHLNEVEPYEALFYYELNRALGNEGKINEWFERYPQYMEYCKLSVQSFEFLAHIGLFDAAITCCQDLYNTSLIVKVVYINNCSDLLLLKGDLQGAFEFLVSVIKDENYFMFPHIISKTAKLALDLHKKDEMLDIFRQCVAAQPRAKWLSKDYITLCLDKGLTAEAQIEYERLLGIVIYVCKDSKIPPTSMGLFEYFCSVRNLMGMEDDKNMVAEELGIQLQETKKKREKSTANYNVLWQSDFIPTGNKALLKRIAKMNKPFRTYFKAFAGGEKELVFAKSILGNYVSIIYNRFKNLFGIEDFCVTDYTAFYEAFPFYSMNGFTEEEVDETSELLTKIRAICIQLNPLVTSRFFPIGPMLADTLSVNTSIKVGDNIFQYQVFDQDSEQITLFGAVVFISTFLNDDEKVAFAFELAGSDVKLQCGLLKQVFNTIPAAKVFVVAKAENGFVEAGREKDIFSLFIRRELFRFLLEFECQIIKEFNLLESDRPNANPKSLDQLLELKYSPDSETYINVKKLHALAVSGSNLGDDVEGEKFTIGNIANLMSKCCDQDKVSAISQAGIESLFIMSVNRKYYNQMKWTHGRTGSSFLRNSDNYCKKMLFRNEELMSEEDEYILFDRSCEHLFTHTDDVQAKEFKTLFQAKAIRWEQIVIDIYKIAPDKCTAKINNQEIRGEYFLAHQDDNIEIDGIDGNQFKGWDEIVVFESPIAKHIVHEAKF